MNINCLHLAGRLTRDVELKFLPKGTAVARVSVAVSRKFKGNDGEWKEETAFVDVTAWGKQAEVVGQYFKKGSRIYLKGRLKTEKWNDKTTGEERSKLAVTMEEFEFVDGKSSSSDSAPAAPRREAPTTADLPPGTKVAPVEEDDVPFN